MPRVGQIRKRDANEPDIVKALKRVGARVIRISERGAPDLLVLWRGDLFVLEVKSRLGGTTLAQDATIGDGWPVFLVRTAEQALMAIGVNR